MYCLSADSRNARSTGLTLPINRALSATNAILQVRRYGPKALHFFRVEPVLFLAVAGPLTFFMSPAFVT